MFKRPTTIIVGAGCSREYGLPLGDDLKDQIADLLRSVRQRDPRKETGGPFITTTDVFDAAFTEIVGYAAGNEWTKWFHVCQEMSKGVRHASSIDRYLDIHRDDPIKIKIGKLAIARQILKAERKSELSSKNDGPPNFSLVGKPKTPLLAGPPPARHWLGQLFQLMQEGATLTTFERAFENLTFVCFNYDRVIEHYLYHAVSEITGAPSQDVTNALSKLKVYHPYGRLGPLRWEGGERIVTFGLDTDDPKELIAMADSINIFTETLEDNDDLKGIRTAIEQSRQVIFLGFSFLEQNMQLLTPENPSSCQVCYATVYEESKYNEQAATTAITKLLMANQRIVQNFTVFSENLRAGDFIGDAGLMLKS